MKIALYMDAPRIGGAERYFSDLCLELAGEPDIELDILSPASELIPFLQRRLGGGVHLWALAPPPKFKSSFAVNVFLARSALRELRSALLDLSPDIFHINNGGYPGSQLARVAVSATSVPRVMTVNSRAQPRRGGARSLYRALDPFVWRNLARVIVPAEAAAADIIAYRDCPQSKVTVIPYGISEAQTDQAQVDTLRHELAPHGEMLVGMIVAPSDDPAVEYKGHNVLLEAAGLLERTDVRFVIVGHDPGQEFAARSANLGLDGRLVLHRGFREAAPYMAACDVLVVPSTRSEALPLVVLEAMSSGIPVVGSHLAGIPEAIVDGENGYMFAVGDPADLAGRLAALAQDPGLRRSLGIGARSAFERKFTSREMAQRTLAVYKEVSNSVKSPLEGSDRIAAVG